MPRKQAKKKNSDVVSSKESVVGFSDEKTRKISSKKKPSGLSDEQKGKKNGVRAEGRGSDRPINFKGKSEIYKEAYLKAFDEARKNKSLDDIDKAKGESSGTHAAKSGGARPVENHFKGKSKAYKEAYLKAFDKANNKMSPSKIEEVQGQTTGKNAARKGYSRPSEVDFQGKSEGYKKAYFKAFDEVSKEMSQSEKEEAQAKSNGKNAARRGCSRPIEADFQGKSEHYKNAYLNAFDEAQKKMNPQQIEEAQGKINGSHAARRGSRRPSDADFQGKSEHYKNAYLNAFDEVQKKMTPQQIEEAQGKANGDNAARKGYNQPSDADFQGKSEDYKRGYINAFDKARKDMTPQQIEEALAKTIGADDAHKGRNRPSKIDLKRKSEAYKKAYFNAFDHVRKDMTPELIDKALGKMNGSAVARNGFSRPSEANFQGKSETYKAAYYNAFDHLRKKMSPQKIEEAQAKIMGADAAREGKNRPAEAYFQEKSEKYKQVYLQTYDFLSRCYRDTDYNQVTYFLHPSLEGAAVVSFFMEEQAVALKKAVICCNKMKKAYTAISIEGKQEPLHVEPKGSFVIIKQFASFLKVLNLDDKKYSNLPSLSQEEGEALGVDYKPIDPDVFLSDDFFNHFVCSDSADIEHESAQAELSDDNKISAFDVNEELPDNPEWLNHLPLTRFNFFSPSDKPPFLEDNERDEELGFLL